MRRQFACAQKIKNKIKTKTKNNEKKCYLVIHFSKGFMYTMSCAEFDVFSQLFLVYKYMYRKNYGFLFSYYYFFSLFFCGGVCGRSVVWKIYGIFSEVTS